MCICHGTNLENNSEWNSECLVDRISIFISLFFLKILGIKHKCDSSIPSLFCKTLSTDWDSEKKKKEKLPRNTKIHSTPARRKVG